MEPVVSQMCLQQHGSVVLLLHLLMEALRQAFIILVTNEDFKCKGVRSLQLVIDPIEASAWTWVTNLFTCGTKWALRV